MSGRPPPSSNIPQTQNHKLGQGEAPAWGTGAQGQRDRGRGAGPSSCAPPRSTRRPRWWATPVSAHEGPNQEATSSQTFERVCASLKMLEKRPK